MIKGLSMFFGPPHEGQNQSKQVRVSEEKVAEWIKKYKKIGFTHFLFNGFLEKPYFPYAHLCDELKVKFWYHLPYHWGEKPRDEGEMWREVRKCDYKNLEVWTVGCELFGGRKSVEKLVRKNHDKVKSFTDKKTCYDHHLFQSFKPFSITDFAGLNAYAPLQGLQWAPESVSFINEEYKAPVRQVLKIGYHSARILLKPFKNSAFLTSWSVERFKRKSLKPVVITEFACRGEPRIISNYLRSFRNAGVNDWFYYNVAPYLEEVEGISDDGHSKVDPGQTFDYFKRIF